MENEKDKLMRELSKKKVSDMSVIDLHNMIIDCLKKHELAKELSEIQDIK